MTQEIKEMKTNKIAEGTGIQGSSEKDYNQKIHFHTERLEKRFQ